MFRQSSESLTWALRDKLLSLVLSGKAFLLPSMSRKPELHRSTSVTVGHSELPFRPDLPAHGVICLSWEARCGQVFLIYHLRQR